MGNVRPFWRSIERERLGTGHSLAVRREHLRRRRLGIMRESAKAERRSARQSQSAPAQAGFFKTTWRKLISYGKKISGSK